MAHTVIPSIFLPLRLGARRGGAERKEKMEYTVTTLDEIISLLLRRKILAMRIERRPGAYWITMLNSTKRVYGSMKYTPLRLGSHRGGTELKERDDEGVSKHRRVLLKGPRAWEIGRAHV